jgi:O-acetyl-ADP-ribose deacetylase (regulator of RNase III)
MWLNPVNTMGVMGGGLAGQFANCFPDVLEDYKIQCQGGRWERGALHVVVRSEQHPLYVVNFPTKRHWKSPSDLELIREGLKELRRIMEEDQIKSLAVPALGCGLGGLDWCDVYPEIIEALQEIPDLEVEVYPPNAGSGCEIKEQKEEVK